MIYLSLFFVHNEIKTEERILANELSYVTCLFLRKSFILTIILEIGLFYKQF